MNSTDTTSINRTIARENARLAPIVDRLNGKDMREEFRGVFNNSAGRFARGLYTLEEFRGITGELIRDASGTVAGQDRDAEEIETIRSGSAPREPWATMPTDGSGRLTKGECGVIGMLGAVVIALLVYVVFLMGGTYGPDMDGGTPAPSPGTAPVAAVSESDTETGAGGKFGTPRVTLELNDLPNSDCWYEVTMTDADGQPGGRKTANIQPLCP